MNRRERAEAHTNAPQRDLKYSDGKYSALLAIKIPQVR
jgi:hypothetical protein